MPEANVETTTAVPDFQRGRMDCFRKIREFFRRDTARCALIAVDDFFPIEDEFRNKKELAEMVVEPALIHYQAGFRSMIVYLEEGGRPYEALGVSDIPGYHHITDGDYAAGVLSAAEDAKAMLLSFDHEWPVTQGRATNPAFAQFEAKIEDGTSRLPSLIRYAALVQTDIALSKIENGIVLKTKRPKAIGYNGEEPGEYRAHRLAFLFNHLVDSSYKFHWIREKMTVSWPPVRDGSIPPASFTYGTYGTYGGAGDGTGKSHADHRALSADENDHPAFGEGFAAELSRIYGALQIAHFDRLADEKSYLEAIGLSPSWSKTAMPLASEKFSELRGQLAGKMRGPATGAGKTADAGRDAARDWVAATIDSLPPGPDPDPNRARILDLLKGLWQADLKDQAAPNPEKGPEKDNVRPARALRIGGRTPHIN